MISFENCEIEWCNVSKPLNAYLRKESSRDKYKITSKDYVGYHILYFELS